MGNWLRFRHGAESYFGTLEGELITVYEGDLFDNPRPHRPLAPNRNSAYELFPYEADNRRVV